jgi:hypothetical protein
MFDSALTRMRKIEKNRISICIKSYPKTSIYNLQNGNL